MAFGSAVHEALEQMYKRLGNQGRLPNQDDYDYVIDVFMKSAVQNHLSDQSLYDEGRLMLKSRLDKFDPSEKVIGLEVIFGRPYENPEVPVSTKKGTPLLGAIDKLIELDKDTIVILDYKTSRMAFTQEEADHDEQLSLYDLVVSILYPQYKNRILVLDYLRLEPVITHRTSVQRVSFESQLDCIYEEIKQLSFEKVKPSINEFCGWCEYKNYCAAFQKVVSDPDLLIKPYGVCSDQELIEEWENFGKIKRIIDSHDRDLKMHISKTAMDRDSSGISGDEKELYRVQNSRVSYNTQAVAKVIPLEDCLQFFSVNTKGLERFLVDHPEYSEEVLNSAEVSFNNSFFKLRGKRTSSRK